jgi:multidrug transporter EmrE-like cation transporter
MNIFSPYKVNSFVLGNLIDIELPSWRKKLNFFTFRIFPFFLFSVCFLAIVLNYKTLPIKYTIMLGIGISALSVYILLQVYLVKTSIHHNQIIIHKKTIRGSIVKSYDINTIKKISCKIRYSKYGGTFFYLTTTNMPDLKIEFITIPFLNMNDENTGKICKEITAISGKEIEMI